MFTFVLASGLPSSAHSMLKEQEAVMNCYIVHMLHCAQLVLHFSIALEVLLKQKDAVIDCLI